MDSILPMESGSMVRGCRRILASGVAFGAFDGDPISAERILGVIGGDHVAAARRVVARVAESCRPAFAHPQARGGGIVFAETDRELRMYIEPAPPGAPR